MWLNKWTHLKGPETVNWRRNSFGYRKELCSVVEFARHSNDKNDWRRCVEKTLRRYSETISRCLKDPNSTLNHCSQPRVLSESSLCHCFRGGGSWQSEGRLHPNQVTPAWWRVEKGCQHTQNNNKKNSTFLYDKYFNVPRFVFRTFALTFFRITIGRVWRIRLWACWITLEMRNTKYVEE